MANLRTGKNRSDLESAPPLEGQDRIMARYCPPVLIALKMQHNSLTVVWFPKLNDFGRGHYLGSN